LVFKRQKEDYAIVTGEGGLGEVGLRPKLKNWGQDFNGSPEKREKRDGCGRRRGRRVSLVGGYPRLVWGKLFCVWKDVAREEVRLPAGGRVYTGNGGRAIP